MKGNSRINECCFVMLIILRLPVLPHKHPHELLDSVVKEQLVKSFVSTEARILQQPLYLSSCFSILFPEKLLSTQPLAPSIRTSSLQREAHSTAFKTAVNHLFQTAFDPFDRTTNRIKPPPYRPARILHARSSFASPSVNLTY